MNIILDTKSFYRGFREAHKALSAFIKQKENSYSSNGILRYTKKLREAHTK